MPRLSQELGGKLLLHAAGWLLVGNLVGLLLSLLLIFPHWNTLLAPMTYGRWVPVHLNVQLYGWGTVPLLGVACKLLLSHVPDAVRHRSTSHILMIWSVSLAFGVVTWLMGVSTGKIFLDWRGPARVVLVAGLVAMWFELFRSWRLRENKDDILSNWLGMGILLLLASVPVLMLVATSPSTYPPINPSSGGPTGVDLFGSTLAIVPLFMFLPKLLELPTRFRPAWAICGWFYLICLGLFTIMPHADGSHHDAIQLIAMGIGGLWLPIIAWHLLAFRWEGPMRLWFWGLAGWASWLMISALVTFLPGVLGLLKFSNALVAHSHAAMAGMVTALCMLLLTGMSHLPVLERRAGWHLISFWCWQTGCILYVAAFTWLGYQESQLPGLLFREHDQVTVIYCLRLLAGSLMLFGTTVWVILALVAMRRPASADLPLKTHDASAPLIDGEQSHA